MFYLNECEEALSEDLVLKLVFILSRNPQWLDILTPHGALMPSGDLTRVSPLQIGCILGHLSAVQKLLKNDSGVPTAENSEHEGLDLAKSSLGGVVGRVGRGVNRKT